MYSLPSARTADFFFYKTIFSCAVVTVFKNHDLLGWYSTGAECKPADIQIHNQVPIILSWSASVSSWCRHNSN
jgi:hypothetical protein